MRQLSANLICGLAALWAFMPSAQAQLPFFEGFEAAPAATYTTNQSPLPNLSGPNHSWTYQSPGIEGRLRTNTTFGFRTGSRGITLDDQVSNTVGSTNYLILTLNLAAYLGSNDLNLSFWYRNHGNETTPWTENKVWLRGNDNAPWIEAIDLLNPLPTNGVWTNLSIDIDSVLRANGQVPSASFQVRFGQQDDQTATSTTGLDGISFDDVSITGTLPASLNDAGIAGLVSPSLGGLPGLQNLEISLGNFGTSPLNSAQINWTLEGLPQPSANFTGPALNSNATTSINLGTYNLDHRPRTFKFWTSQPNGGADANAGNDTLTCQLCAGLSGTYTVGTPSSDYPSLAAANQALQICGVRGPVTFQVQAGTYSGQLIFRPARGISANNTVTFDGGNVATLTHLGTTTTGPATVLFYGCKHYTLQNFTVRNTGTGFGSFGVHLIMLADSNQILNNQILMPPATSDAIPIVASGSLTDDFTSGVNAQNTLIQGNLLRGGQMGMHLRGIAAFPSVNNRIIDNIVEGFNDQGIYTAEQTNLEIINNTIRDYQSTFSGDGLYLLGTRDAIIQKNNIAAGRYGIYLSGFNGSAPVTRRGDISNNMVRCDFNSAGYFLTVRETNIYHNTFVGGGTNPGVYMSTFSLNNLVNNIFYGTNGQAFNSITNTAQQRMDYNLFHTENNATLIRYGTTNYATLADWQAASFAHDANSVAGNPIFASATDLHVEGILANDAGDNSLGITTDIDGDTRPFPSSTQVDIGADEYRPKFNDAGVVALVQPTPPLNAGFAPVSVRVRNFGNDSLRSFNVSWSFNGLVLGTQAYTGPALAPRGEVVINLGSLNFPNNGAAVAFWTSLPNGLADERPSNDTLNVNACIALSGTYTIGNTGANFPNLNAAVQALNSCGVSGPVVFQVQAGIYQEQLALREIPGASGINTITFEGNQLATLRYNGGANPGQAAVLLDGADHIRIRNFRIEHNGAAPAWGIHLINRADSNQLVGNTIVMPAGTSNITGIVASSAYNNEFTEGNPANYTLIQGNTITGGNMGIHLEGAFNAPISGNRIIANRISNVNLYGIYSDDQDSLDVINNEIFDMISATGDGIYMFDNRDLIMTGNNVRAPRWGIYISNTNSGTYIPARRTRIVNNMALGRSGYGLYALSLQKSDVYHNTFVGGDYGAYVTNPVDLDVRNNIFAANSIYALWCPTNAAIGTLDYNLYYVPPTATALIRFGTTNYPNLATWQAAFVGLFDVNSVEGNPLFISNEDLHVRGPLANNIGDNTVGVTVDVDGDARPFPGSTRVDIGADEFDPIANDLLPIVLLSPRGGECGVTNDSIVLVIQNLGTTAVTSANINTQISGSQTANLNFNYTGNLAPQSFDTITLAPLNTFAGGNFNFRIITQLTGDQFRSNDTLEVFRSVRPGGALVGQDDTTCVGQSANLTVAQVADLQLNWFDTPSGGSPIFQGQVFNTPTLANNTTYYVEPAAFTADSLTTTFAAGNGCGSGNMFNLTATNTVIITGLAVLPALNATTNVTVWYIPNGSYIGNANNQAAWTLLGTVPNISTTAPFTLPTSLTIPAGSTYAIYVEYNARYTNGSATYSTADLTLSAGMGHCSSFSTGITDRIFNGTIYYNRGGTPCDPTRVPVQAVVTTAPSVNLGNDTTICAQNALASFDAQNIGASYLWNTGATTQNIQVSDQGTYAVTITDRFNCQASDEVEVNYLPTPLLSLNGDEVACFGDNTAELIPSIIGGTGNFTYLWSNGQTNAIASDLGAGLYTLSLSDPNNCVYILQASVTQPSTALDATNLLVNGLDCAGNAVGSLNLNPSGGTPNYTFLWNNNATTSNLSGLSAGTYTVTLTDANGCTATNTAQISAPSSPSISLLNLTDENNQIGGAIEIALSGGQAPYQVRWNTGQTGTSISGLIAGTYTVVVEDANGCTSSLDFTVNYNVSTNLEGLANLSQVELFPNPTKQQSLLRLTLHQTAEVELELLDILGRRVKHYGIQSVDNNLEHTLDLGQLASGLYFVRVRIGSEHTSLRLIKE